jgi:hypothetical protein
MQDMQKCVPSPQSWDRRAASIYMLNSGVRECIYKRTYFLSLLLLLLNIGQMLD